MALSSTQKFLVGAASAASAEGYFRPRDVGRALGFTAEESARALRALAERNLIAQLQEGQARLRSEGRAMASRLDRETLGQAAASPAGRYRGPGPGTGGNGGANGK